MSAEPHAPSPTGESSPGPIRTAKRPQACLACRRIKHKCKPSPVGKQPCLRCHKKGQSCVFASDAADPEWQENVTKELGDLRRAVSDLQGLVKTLSTVASNLAGPPGPASGAAQPVTPAPHGPYVQPWPTQRVLDEGLAPQDPRIPQPELPPLQSQPIPRSQPPLLPIITAPQPRYPPPPIDLTAYDQDLASIFASTRPSEASLEIPRPEPEETPRPKDARAGGGHAVASMGTLNGATTDLLVMCFMDNVAPHTTGLSLKVGKFPLPPDGLTCINSYLALVVSQLAAERLPAYHNLVRFLSSETTIPNLLGDWVERYEHDPVLPKKKITPEEIVGVGLVGMYASKRNRTGHGVVSFNLARAYAKAKSIDHSSADAHLAPLLFSSSTLNRVDGLRMILFCYIAMIHSIVVVSRQVPPQADITPYTDELYSLPDGPSYVTLIIHARVCQILATCWDFPESPSSPLSPTMTHTIDLPSKMGQLDSMLDACILDMQRWMVDSPMVVVMVCYVRMVISLLSNAEQRLPSSLAGHLDSAPSTKPQVISIARQMLGIMDKVCRETPVAFLPSAYFEITRQAGGVALKHLMRTPDREKQTASELAGNKDVLAQVERIAMAFVTSSLISDRLIHLHGRVLLQAARQVRSQLIGDSDHS